MKNTLYYGDNLDVLRKYIKDETVDLCYCDPPFNSKRNYNQIYNNIGTEDRAQAQAFVDTWTWDDHAGAGFAQLLANEPARFTSQTIELMKGLHAVLGKGSLLAYLVSMTLRITEIHRVLKPTGSFYLHCDSTASHYLKLVLDTIFVTQGGEYQNEIIWKRKTGRGETNHKSFRFGVITDTIFFYTKSKVNVFHTQYNFEAEGYRDYVGKFFIHTDEQGRKYRIADLSSPNPRPNLMYDYKGYKPPRNGWAVSIEKMQQMEQEGRLHFPATLNGRIQRRRFEDELQGKTVQSLWDDIDMISSQAAERLGYPTQKPEALLERIIQASTNPGDVVLDAYCGCGTTIAVAQKLGRSWIGMDITYQSISLILRRLEAQYGKAALADISLSGIPQDMASAVALANKKDDRVRKEFEKWAVLTYTNNRAIINQKKGADAGVDGIAYFQTSHEDNAKIIFQVKSGHVQRGDIAKLRGDMEREGAALAVFLTLEPPSGPMRAEAKEAGLYSYDLMQRNYDRIQIVTVQEMVEEGRRLEIPMSLEVLKKAQSVTQESQLQLLEAEAG